MDFTAMLINNIYILFNVYNFECLNDVIYEVENALCNINKQHLQLNKFVY
jgi:hypothetical protein